MLTRWWTLFALELRLEFRQRVSLAGVLLFVAGVAYLFSLAFGALEPRLWNALFWVVLLFGAVNGLAGAFRRELTYRYAYYHQLAAPLELYAAKAAANTLLLLVVGLLAWGALGLLFGNPVRDAGLFALALGLGSLGLALTLTFLAALAGRVRSGGTGLVAILAFPVVVPLLLTTVKLGAVATRVVAQTSTAKDVGLLGGVVALSLGLALLLVPAVWREG